MKKKSNSIKRVCIVSSSRADYWLLKDLIKKLKNDKKVKLLFIVTGQHLLSKFGNTYKQIEDDNIFIDAKIKCLSNSDSSVGISSSIASTLKKFGQFFKTNNPDLVILLGDRYEILAVAIASAIAKLPIAHIHGGELTQGAVDDAFRHSITKMSHIHFVAATEYRNRVIQLGEQPKNVHLIGSLGVEQISKIKFLTKNQLLKKFKIKLNDRNLIVTFHPVTLEIDDSEKQIEQLINVLSKLKKTTILFTMPNADVDNEIIIKKIKLFKKNNINVHFFENLGQINYFSIIRIFDGVVGNSSSGLIEVPSFKKGTINIGDRQKGRLLASSVINCNADEKSISKAIKKLYSEDFQKALPYTKNPYQCYRPVNKILSVIKKTKLDNLIKKEFYDVKIKN